MCVLACRDKREIKTKLHRIEKQKRREEKIVCFSTRAGARTHTRTYANLAENAKSTGLCTFAPNTSHHNTTHTHTHTQTQRMCLHTKRMQASSPASISPMRTQTAQEDSDDDISRTCSAFSTKDGDTHTSLADACKTNLMLICQLDQQCYTTQ